MAQHKKSDGLEKQDDLAWPSQSSTFLAGDLLAPLIQVWGNLHLKQFNNWSQSFPIWLRCQGNTN